MPIGVTSGTSNYQYCEDCTGATQNVVVTLQPATCVVYQDGISSGDYIYKTRTNLVFTIPSAIECDLVINYRERFQWRTDEDDPGVSGNTYLTTTILAGQISKTITNKQCYWLTYWDNNPANYQILEYDWSIRTQQTLPSCTQPLGCDIAITNAVAVPPSLIGASDGSITVSISGATGSSYTFRLNGGIAQSSNVFSGIPSGTYQVRVQEGACFDEVEVVVPAGAYNTSPFTITEPASVVASENPIVLELQSAFFDGSEQHSTTTLTVNSGIKNNYRMTFTLISPISYQVTFTAKDFPNRNVYFLTDELTDQNGDHVKDNSNDEIADTLAQVLQTDIVISSAYYINVVGNVVTLRAKTASSRFDLTYNNITTYNPASVVVVTGVTVSLTQGGTDRYEAGIIDNYRFYTEVYGNAEEDLEYGSTLTPTQFNRITELQLPFLRNNTQKFDFSEICKSFLFTPKPDYELSGFTTVTSYMQPFYFKYGELYPLIPNTPTAKKKQKGQTDYVWVMNAAIDFEQPNIMTGYTGTTISSYLRNVPFLTNSPVVKRASRRQRELLYFIVPQNLNQGTLAVKGDIVFWDGTTLPTQTFTTITTSSVNFGGAFCINVSFDVLGLDVVETTYNKLIKQLNIGVYSGGGSTRNVTAIKSYAYDLEEHTNRVGLSWLNKLGTFDSFDFAGQAEESVDRSAKSFTLPKTINADGSVNAGFKYNATYDVALTKKIKVNSGWIDSQTFNWLMELLASNEIYIYSSDDDNYVNVIGYKYSKSSNDTLYNLELDLIETIAENNISV